MITNRTTLVSNGSNDLFRKLRSDACDIFEEALKSVDPEQAIYNSLKLEGDILDFEGASIDLSNINRIFIIGGGKAGGLMSKAVETIFGDRITDGIVNVLEGTENAVSLRYILLNGASHPVPSQSGVEGVKRMLELTNDLRDDDLVISLISGGGSSLMPMPAEKVTLNDLQEVTGKLLKAGATINELNTVRKHLSKFKGGQLARHCYPATVLSLILSDVIGDPLDVIASGPTVPDTSNFADALNVLKKYCLLEDVPLVIMERLRIGAEGRISETPKEDDLLFNRVFNILIADNPIAAEAAKREAKRIGYNSIIYSTRIAGEAREVGVQLAEIAQKVISSDKPVRKPAVIIVGGETTVTVKGNGKGGRNQELALAASEKIHSLPCLIATLGTDGIDGPTEAAGAFADGSTLAKTKEKRLNPVKFLEENDSFNFFDNLGDLVITGPTGTNVNDLILIMVK